jgi:long-subunit acyl-CoA synthetase (AMP-forming)
MSQKKLNTLLKIPIISKIVKNKIKKSLGWSRAGAIVSGAAFLPQEIIDWYSKLDVNILNGYGMTENCCVCSYLDTKSPSGKGSVGLPWDMVEVRIGDDGSILNKGPFLLKEYFKNKEYTDEVLVDGWFNTGDKGYIDENGFLHITGRVKDIFKTSKGKYIEPHLIEEKFEKSNLFQQLCVVGLGLSQPILLGVPNEISKLNKDETTEKINNLLEKINSSMDSYKKIKKVVFLKDEWTPENDLTTPTLKIKRAKIDEEFAKNYESWYNNDNVIIWQ